jgi:para-aminobenzoate synthetase component 1
VPTILAAIELGGWTDPEALFRGGPALSEHAFWLDAGPDAEAGWSWLGEGTPAADVPRDVRCDRGGPGREWGRFGGGWVGWLDYDAAAHRAGAPSAAVDAGTGRGLHVRRFVACDHATRRQWAVAPADEVSGFAAEVRRWASAAPPVPAPAADPVLASGRHTAAQYAELIERCREAIREGDAYQLCLTTRFDIPASVDALEAYRRLRRATPAHHGGFLRVGDTALASASPERFLEAGSGVVRTHPIKGTRPRGAEPAADAALVRELRASEKERAENVMIVDLMRNDLQRVCEPGTVTVERLLEVESYPAVHQLVSTVAGRLRPGTTLGEILDAAFPAGSMTGAPKLSAMTILHSLERHPRGIFSGCFGWVGDDGGADLAMVIRSVVVGPNGAYVGAGGGITWASEAAAEVAEVGVKARGPLAAAGATLPAGWEPDAR